MAKSANLQDHVVGCQLGHTIECTLKTITIGRFLHYYLKQDFVFST